MSMSPLPITIYTDSEGNPLSNGYLLVSISTDAKSSGGQVCAGSTVNVPLDVNGTVESGITFWTNASLTPSDTVYIVNGYKASGQPACGPIHTVVV